jgi:hypothetical protein
MAEDKPAVSASPKQDDDIPTLDVAHAGVTGYSVAPAAAATGGVDESDIAAAPDEADGALSPSPPSVPTGNTGGPPPPPLPPTTWNVSTPEPPRIQLTAYIQEKQQDYVRLTFTVGLLLMFGWVIVWASIESASWPSHWEQTKDMLQIILPALTGLIGSVSGFYFGSRGNAKPS